MKDGHSEYADSVGSSIEQWDQSYARIKGSWQRCKAHWFTRQGWMEYGLPLFRHIGHRITEDRCIESAAALTFTTLLAIVPVLTVLYAILAMIPSLQQAGDQLQNWLFQHFVPASAQDIQTYIQKFAKQAGQLTKFGVLFLFITALMMMKRIEKSFNLIWRVPKPRTGVVGFMRYWAVLSLGPILIGFGLGVSSYVASMAIFSDTVELLGIKVVVFSMVPLLLSWIAFSLIYWVVPNCTVPFRQSLVGGLIAAIAFDLAKRIFTLFVAKFANYQFVYGAFAALPMFLIWLYLSWVIILLGAVVTRSLTVFRPQAWSIRPVIGCLAVLYQVWQAQKDGRGITERELMAAIPELSPDDWQAIRTGLRDHDIIARTDQDTYLLCCDLSQIKLDELLLNMDYFEELNTLIEQSKPLSSQWDAQWLTDFASLCAEVEAQRKACLSIPVSSLFLDKAGLSKVS